MQTAELMARKFHEKYERLAPKYGYDTRKDTREFDPESSNGKLMIAVCGEIISDDPLSTEIRRLRAALSITNEGVSGEEALRAIDEYRSEEQKDGS